MAGVQELFRALMQGCGTAPGGDAHDLADQLQNLGLQQNLDDTPPAAYRVFTFDTEATDRDTSSAGIWEIAMVDLTTRQHFQQMLNPGPAYRMSARAAQITGVDPRTIRNPDLPDLQSVFTSLLDWVDQQLQPGQTPVIIGYNSHTYDFKVLGRNLAALSPPMQVPSHYHTCDLYRIMRAYKAKEALRLDNLHQGTLAKHFLGSFPVGAHRALNDALVLAELVPLALTWCRSQQQQEGQVLDKLRPIPVSSISLEVRSAGAGVSGGSASGAAPGGSTATYGRAAVRRSTGGDSSEEADSCVTSMTGRRVVVAAAAAGAAAGGGRMQQVAEGDEGSQHSGASGGVAAPGQLERRGRGRPSKQAPAVAGGAAGAEAGAINTTAEAEGELPAGQGAIAAAAPGARRVVMARRRGAGQDAVPVGQMAGAAAAAAAAAVPLPADVPRRRARAAAAVHDAGSGAGSSNSGSSNTSVSCPVRAGAGAAGGASSSSSDGESPWPPTAAAAAAAADGATAAAADGAGQTGRPGTSSSRPAAVAGGRRKAAAAAARMRAEAQGAESEGEWNPPEQDEAVPKHPASTHAGNQGAECSKAAQGAAGAIAAAVAAAAVVPAAVTGAAAAATATGPPSVAGTGATGVVTTSLWGGGKQLAVADAASLVALLQQQPLTSSSSSQPVSALAAADPGLLQQGGATGWRLVAVPQQVPGVRYWRLQQAPSGEELAVWLPDLMVVEVRHDASADGAYELLLSDDARHRHLTQQQASSQAASSAPPQPPPAAVAASAGGGVQLDVVGDALDSVVRRLPVELPQHWVRSQQALKVKVRLGTPASSTSSSSGSGHTTSVSQGPPASLQQLPQLLSAARSSGGGTKEVADTQQRPAPQAQPQQQQQQQRERRGRYGCLRWVIA